MSSSKKRRSSGEEKGAGGLIHQDEKRTKIAQDITHRSQRTRKTTSYAESEGTSSDSTEEFQVDTDEESDKSEEFQVVADEESDKSEEEDEVQIWPPSNKYHKDAGKVVSDALNEVLLKCSCETKVVDLCKIGDESIVDEMAAHVNGCIATIAHTYGVRKEGDAVRGRSADVIVAANTVAKRLKQKIRPGAQMRNIRSELEDIVKSYHCKFIRMHVYVPEQFVMDYEDVNVYFKEDTVYVIDIITSTSEQVEELDSSHATVLKLKENAKDHLDESSLQIFDKIHKNFHVMPFSLRALEEIEENIDVEPMMHDMLQPYLISCVNEGEFVAHVKFMVLLKGKRLIQITDPPKSQNLIPLLSFEKPWLAVDENTVAARNNNKPGEMELVYVGMLPIGEEGSGVQPVIEGISVKIKNKNLFVSPEVDLEFVCCGSFGTYLCSRKGSGNNDLESGWDKKLIWEHPAKRCSWNPKANVIAIGVVPDRTGQVFLRGRVHLFNLNTLSQIATPYEAQSSEGLNSLCWSKSGEYLLFAGDNTKSVGVIKLDKRSLTQSWVAQVPYSVHEMGAGHRSNCVGAFHPFKSLFVVATSSGIINIFRKKLPNQIIQTQQWYREWDRVAGRQKDYGICAVQFDCDGSKIICKRTNGGIVVCDHGIVSEDGRIPQIVDLYILDVNGLPNVNFMPGVSSYLATVDKAQLISIYDQNLSMEENGRFPICHNGDKLNPTKQCDKTDTMEWIRRNFFVCGGEDGMAFFWMILPQSRMYDVFEARRRDFILEKTFYSRKRASLASIENINAENKSQTHALASYLMSTGAELAKREEQRTRAIDLANGGLLRMNKGEELTQDEMRSYLEEIEKSLRF